MTQRFTWPPGPFLDAARKLQTEDYIGAQAERNNQGGFGQIAC
jgi:hypothetical protein